MLVRAHTRRKVETLRVVLIFLHAIQYSVYPSLSLKLTRYSVATAYIIQVVNAHALCTHTQAVYIRLHLRMRISSPTHVARW